ncbi:MAG: hypothetical protein VYC13_06060 [Actinomycetota bacterium]|nr:hypothetical protein [Actinomycetota bacterium]
MDDHVPADDAEGTGADARGDGEAIDPTLPHTPPFGIKAVHPGDEPPVAPPGPEPETQRRERPAGNGLAAMAATIGVVLAIMGTFLPWTVSDRADGEVDHLIGWDLAGDAVLVLLTGLVAAGVAGALWVGQRGLVHKVVLLATGGMLLAVAGVEISDVRAVDAVTSLDRSVGSGLPVVAFGGVLMVGAALLDRGSWSPRSR